MIDISTEAKMLLMDNRKTLFKADLILDASKNSVTDASGLNLDNHENEYVGHSEVQLQDAGIWWYEGYGCDFKDVPIDLLQRYKYMFLSMDVRCNEISEETELSPGVYFITERGTRSNAYISSTKYSMVSGSDYIRISARFEISKMDTFNTNIRNAQQLIGIYGHLYKSGLSLNIDYKDAMIEFNNTGIASEYVDCYVVNGGSYDNVSTLKHLTGVDVMANTVSFSDSVSGSGSFEIGSAIINSLALTLNNYSDKFSTYDFAGAKLRAYTGIPLENTEWITKGYYTVDKPTSAGSTIPITMLDNMSKFEKPYSEITQIYPATLSSILQTICLYCGVVLNSTTFPNSSMVIQTRPDDENLSCLSMVAAVAQLAGCYARVNRYGYLTLSWYDPTAFDDESDDYDGGTFLTETTPYSDGDTLDGGDFSYDGTEDVADGGEFTYGKYFSCYAFSSFSVGTDDITITGIKVTVDSDNYFAVGEDGYVLEISDNPLITADNMETVAQFLGNKIIGLKFRPFNVSALSDPTVEAGDAIRLTDRKGNSYDSFITSCTYKYGNYESFSCDAETVSQRNAVDYSPLTKAVEQAKKDTQKVLTAYDEAVQNMSSLQTNALGYFETFTDELDGSRTSYMHDKPLLEDSIIIWRKSVSGMFVSTDGGATWGGMTADLNIVARVLNVIGINADWINAGTITGRRINNGNGTFFVNENGYMQAVSGKIAGMDITNESIGSQGSSASMAGSYLSSNGFFSISRANNHSSWARVDFDLFSSMINFYTGAGGDTGSEGIRITNSSYPNVSSYIRYGSQNINKNTGEYVQWISGSDRKIKKNIKPIGARFIRKIFKKILPVSFQYNGKTNNNSDKTHYGVVAQDIEEIFNELGIDTNFVTTTDDKWKFVNYHEFHGLEISAIKDLYETVEKQQCEIKELKKQLEIIMEKVGG